MSAFLCDAIRVTEAITADCAIALEGEASKMAAALGRWKHRNRSAARALQQQCAGRIEELAKTGRDVAEMQARMDELNGAKIFERTSAPRALKVAQCTELLRDLDSKTLDLKQYE